jgi:hypothetical protein
MQFIETLRDLLSTFNWHSPSWDLFILLGWIVAAVMYAFAAGKGRIMSVLVSIYMAKLIVLEAPFLGTEISQRLNVAQAFQELAAFLVLFFVLFLFLARYAFRSASDSRHAASFVFTLAFAVMQIGLLVNIVIGFLPAATVQSFSPLVRFLFVDRPADFIWLVLPVVYIIVLGKFISDRNEN